MEGLSLSRYLVHPGTGFPEVPGFGSEEINLTSVLLSFQSGMGES